MTSYYLWEIYCHLSPVSPKWTPNSVPVSLAAGTAICDLASTTRLAPVRVWLGSRHFEEGAPCGNHLAGEGMAESCSSGGRPQGCISERHLHQWNKQCWTFSFLRAACHMPLAIVPRSLAPPWATQLTESVCPLWVTTLGTAEANREEKPKNLEWLSSGVVNQEWEKVDQETIVFYYKPLFSCWAF